jgi:F0F1-type ATP synthase delta subunit
MSKIPRQDVAHAIAQRIEHAGDTADLAREIAAYLIETGRESDLDSIMRDVMNMRRSDGLLEADIRTAHPLDAETMAQLGELIQREFTDSNQLVIDQSTAPQVIGGVRIVTASEQLDLSVRGKLDKFKRLTNGGTVS